MNLSCIKATELIEKKELFRLSFIENVRLKVHLSMCSSCKEYGRQSKMIDEALRKSSRAEIKFSDAEKLEMIKKCKGE